MIDTAFERIYRTNIARAIEGIQTNLGKGQAKDSLYEYGRSVGTIAGLTKALALIDDTSKQMGGAEQSIAAQMARTA